MATRISNDGGEPHPARSCGDKTPAVRGQAQGRAAMRRAGAMKKRVSVSDSDRLFLLSEAHIQAFVTEPAPRQAELRKQNVALNMYRTRYPTQH